MLKIQSGDALELQRYFRYFKASGNFIADIRIDNDLTQENFADWLSSIHSPFLSGHSSSCLTFCQLWNLRPTNTYLPIQIIRYPFAAATLSN